MQTDAWIPLDLPFKAARQYLQGADIYDAVSQLAQKTIGASVWVNRITIRKAAHYNIDVCFGEFDSDSKDVVAVFSIRGSDDYNKGGIRVSDRIIEKQIDFDEGRITGNSKIFDTKIFQHAPSGCKPVENVIAITKELHQSVLPVKKGRWIFTSLDLKRPLGASRLTLFSVQLKNILGNKMTVSDILDGDQKIGTIRFTVAEL